MTAKTNSFPKEPPLQTEESIHIDPDTGLEIPITIHRRGILGLEMLHFSADNILAYKSSSAEEFFQALQEHIRNQLETMNLPSDRQRLWVREEGGEWRPETAADEEKEPLELKGRALWTRRVEALTEPLSRGRLGAELLFAINMLLKRPGIEEHLWHIGQVMSKYHSYRLCGSINTLAVSGRTGRLARKAGPTARHQRTEKVRAIIWEHAERHWKNHHALPKDGSSTARAIVDRVNVELRERGLLRAKPLSEKTIADHIRAGNRGKVFQTG